MNSCSYFVCGPTANGKSAFAIRLAKKIGGIIVNADSMQVYSNLEILTARPSKKDHEKVEHLLYGYIDGKQRYNVANWCKDISLIIEQYKKNNKLTADFIGRGGAWLDTGSIEDYYKTSAFVQAVENRQGLKIACLEEISLINKWIDKKKVLKQIKFYGNCEYSNYLKKIIN